MQDAVNSIRFPPCLQNPLKHLEVKTGFYYRVCMDPT